MNRFLPKSLIVGVLLFIAGYSSKAQTTPYAYKGLYVYAIDTILSDATGNAENILFRYCRDSSFNAITISIGCLNLHTSPSYTAKLAAFIKKGRTRYGVKYFSAVVSEYTTLLTEVHPFQISRTDTLERFNHYNFEFEYWNDANYNSGKTYCTNFLTPGGYSCDSVGAWSYFSKNMKRVDSLAAADGIKSTVYIGVSSKDTLKNRFVANTVDLVMLACYNADTSKLYMGHTIAKLTAYSKASHKVDVLPIFASLTKSAAENLKQYLIGPAPVGKHSEASAMPIFMREYATLSATVKSKINIVGYKWFKYGGMPKDSTNTAILSVPTSITAVPSATSALLSWAAVSGATAYRIMYAKANTYNFTTVSTSTNSYTLAGLQANTAYQFVVYSVISTKTSASSTLVSFTTTATGAACTLPTGLSSSAISDVAATLSWAAVAGASSYNLQYRIVGTASWISSTSATTSKSLTGLTASSSYEFQVQANCGAGSLSAFTASSNFSTTSAPCNAPSGLGSSGVTTNSATVLANAVANAVSYNIQYRTVGASTWTATPSPSVSKTISGLTPATSYEFQVQAVCNSNSSPFSSSSNFATPAPPCNIPSGLSSSAVSNLAATLSWTAVSGATSYAIQYRIVGAATWMSSTSTSASKTISGLSASSTYEFQIQTVCSASSSSAFSTSSNFTTAAPPCAIASGLSSSSVTDNSATISWTAVSGASSYAIQYRVSGTSVWSTATSATITKNLSGLSASSTYEFQVQTVCSASNSSAFSSSSNFTTPAPPCNVPVGLSSTSVTNSSALLSWTAFAGASSYTVQYRVVSAATWTSASCAVTSNSISGLLASTNYEFQVKSVCSASNSSAFSSSSTFSTPAPPCNTPAGLSSSNVTHNGATIGWTAVPGASGYNIKYRVVGAATWTTTTGTSVSKILSSLSSSSNYEFQVQADCGSGNTSAFAASATFTTAATPCTLPSGLTSTSVTSTSATLNWSAASGASGYLIQYRIVGSASWTSVTSASNSKNISGLTASSNYEFQVQSDCGAGNISAFTASSLFTTPAPPCSVVTGLAAASITENSAILNWVDFAGTSGYNIRYRIIGAASWTNATSSINTKSLSGLTASSAYEFQIQSDCGSGNTSAFSASVNFTSLAPPCNVPTGLSPSAVTNSSATLSWNAISGANGYTIQYRVVGAATWTTLTNASSSYNLSGLSANTTYEFGVQTNCTSNSSAFAAATSFATSAPPCILPSGLAAASVSDATATLSWGAVSGAANYNIQYRIVGTSVWTTGSSASNSLNISSLSASSNYEFQVQTECSSGNTSAFSTSANFSTLAAPCSIPSGLSSASVTDNSVSLTWNNNASALSYTVQYRIIGSSTWTPLSSNLNSKNISGLSPVSNYEFQVKSDCGAGNTSAFSSSSNFVTLAPPCNIPTGLSASSVTENAATLSWNAVSGAASYSVQYRIVGAANWTVVSSIVPTKQLSNLSASSNYEFQVQTECTYGNTSSFSASLNFTTPAPPCNTPSGLSTSGVTYNAATLNWTSAIGASAYTIKYHVVGAATWTTASSANNSLALTALQASTNYEFQVQSDCGGGNASAYSSVVDFFTPAAPCNMPSGLSSSAVTYNSATVNWNTLAGINSFTIRYRIVGAATWSSLTSVTNSKSLTALTPSSNYEFQIQSDCGNANTSAFTASANFTTPAPPCNAPTGLSSSAITYNSATINWTAYSGATAYILKYRVIGAPTWTSVNSSNTTYNLTNLSSSANYEFKIQSDCGNSNTSSFTSTSTFVTPAPPCNAPVGLNASSVTYNSAILNWGIVAGVSSYTVQYRVVGTANWINTSSASNSKTVTGLNASSNYEFQLQSDCGNGNLSSFSASSTFSTPAPPCSVPSALMASSITDVSANLDWSNFAGAGTYNLQYRIIGSSTWTSVVCSINSKNISGLSASTTYEFQVQSDCGNGNVSAYSGSSNFSTTATPCNIPSGLNASAVTNNTATLNWNAIAGAVSYAIHYRVVGTPTWTDLVSNTNSLNISGLNANATYEFEVQSICSASSSSIFSSTSTFATSAPPCLSPSNLVSASITGDAADVSWTAVATAVNYNVQYRIVGSSVWNTVSGANTTITLNALTPLSNYEFQVQTECASGNTSPFSNSATFSTLAPPCNPPVGLAVASITENSATLNWVDFSGASSYTIQYRITGTTTWTNLSSILNSKNLSGLNGSTGYEFRVQSNCGAGNVSVFTDSVSFITLAPPCNIPSGLGASALTYNSAMLDWNAVPNAVAYNYNYRLIGSAAWISGTVTSNSLNLTGLNAAANYEFQVQCDCGNSNTSNFSSASAFTTQAAPCGTPTNLASASVTYNSATISWTPVAGATSYTIQYKISVTNSWNTLNSTSASKSLVGLSDASLYEFGIAADCGNGNTSIFSTNATFTTLAAPCTIPVGLTAVSNSPTDASINWTSVAGAIGYTVQYRISGSTSWLSVPSTTNSAYLPNLSHSSSYEYQVQSDCGSGNTSAFTSSATFNTAVPACNAPSTLAATNLTSNSALLDWASVSGAASYNLQYRVTGATTWISATSNSSSKSLTNLNPTTSYEFQIQTVCIAGNSSAFSASSVFTTDIPPCNTPSGLAASLITDNSAQLNWTAFSGANSYSVQYKESTASNWISLTCNSNSISITNLQASATYQFQIESNCGIGVSSGYSAPATFTTLAQPCIAPLGLSVNSVTSSTASITWNGQSNAQSYTISYRLNGAANWMNLNSNTTSINLSGLTPSSTYEYQVQSNCAIGSSPFSSIANFATGNPSCTITANLSSTNITQTSANIAWDAVAGASSYLIEYRVVGTNVWTSVSSNTTSESLSGLLPASSYEFHVQTICSASNSSAFTNAATFATIAPPCGIAAGLISAGATSTSVSLSWNPVQDATSYSIQYRVSGSSTWQTVNSNVASVNLLGLTANSIYEYQVQTTCTYGLSQYSNSGSFATLSASGCDTPTGLFASSIKSSSAKLNWNPANGASSYKVQYRKQGSTIWTNKTTSYTNKCITSLVPFTPYEFQVQTNCTSNTSAYSSAFLFTTAKSLGAKTTANYNARAAHSALGITLNWTSSSETNLAFYTIERSEDNIEFEPIRNIAAAGNSTFAQDYEFNDIDMKLSPAIGTVWYRLSMTDNLGNVTYLRTIEVTQINEFEDVFKVYPNPTTDDNINLTVKLDHHEEMLVVLMDILGNQVYSKVVVTDDNGFAASGINPGKDLKPGIYEIVGYSSKRQMSKKLIIY
ncbi:MAG: fibronectin type III domain-containing protein [Bacteroidetes bacterium]|nr:fibronectin type III domain-containing protein [Bacteroidota bacterium]